MSEEALQIAVKEKRSEKQGRKGKKYPFECRVPKNSKEKAFLSDQCKEIEGKTRDFFKKIRDTKGTLHAKMGSIKDRNGMDLSKAEDLYLHPGMQSQLGLRNHHYEKS